MPTTTDPHCMARWSDGAGILGNLLGTERPDPTALERALLLVEQTGNVGWSPDHRHGAWDLVLPHYSIAASICWNQDSIADAIRQWNHNAFCLDTTPDAGKIFGVLLSKCGREKPYNEGLRLLRSFHRRALGDAMIEGLVDGALGGGEEMEVHLGDQRILVPRTRFRFPEQAACLALQHSYRWGGGNTADWVKTAAVWFLENYGSSWEHGNGEALSSLSATALGWAAQGQTLVKERTRALTKAAGIKVFVRDRARSEESHDCPVWRAEVAKAGDPTMSESRRLTSSWDRVLNRSLVALDGTPEPLLEHAEEFLDRWGRVPPDTAVHLRRAESVHGLKIPEPVRIAADESVEVEAKHLDACPGAGVAGDILRSVYGGAGKRSSGGIRNAAGLLKTALTHPPSEGGNPIPAGKVVEAVGAVAQFCNKDRSAVDALAESGDLDGEGLADLCRAMRLCGTTTVCAASGDVVEDAAQILMRDHRGDSVEALADLLSAVVPDDVPDPCLLDLIGPVNEDRKRTKTVVPGELVHRTRIAHARAATALMGWPGAGTGGGRQLLLRVLESTADGAGTGTGSDRLSLSDLMGTMDEIRRSTR